MASSLSATGSSVIQHRPKGAESVVANPATGAQSSAAIEEARRMAMANAAVPANNTTTTDDSAVSFSDDQEDEEVDDEDDDEEDDDNASAAAQAAFNAAAAAAAAAAFQRQLLANFPMFHDQQKDTDVQPSEGNPFETYIAAAAAAAAAANAEALIRHQQQLVSMNSGGRTSRSEKRAAHDSGTDDTDLSQRSALQPNQKRRKQSKPVRISSDGPGAEAHPALSAFLAAQSAAAALFQANQHQDEYERRHEEQEEGQLPPANHHHPSMARNLAEFLTSSGAMHPSGKSFYPTPSARLMGDYPGMFHAPEEGDNSRPSSHSSSPDSKKNSPADDLAAAGKFGNFLPATSTPGGAYGPASHPFLFPFLTGGTPATANKTGSVSGVRIFNHEAYCELCNKEFCNKYFLKTHKANKHGIYVDGVQASNSSGGGGGATAAANAMQAPVSSSSSALPPSSPAASQTVSTPASTPNPPFSAAGGAATPYSGAPLSLTVGAMSYAMQPPNAESANSSEPVNFSPIMSTPPLAGSAQQKMATPMNAGLMDLFPLWSANNSALANSNGQPSFLPMKQQQHQPGGIVNPEAYCELCQKEFCNKYFLKRHKAKMHGITPPEGAPVAAPGAGSKSKSKSQSSKSSAASTGGVVDLIKIPLTPASSAVTSPSAANATAAAAAAAGSESGSEHPTSEHPAPENSFSLLMMSDNNQPKAEPTQSSQQQHNNKDSLSLLKIPTPSLSGMFSSSPSLMERLPKTPSSLMQQQQQQQQQQQGQLFSPERLRQMGVINTEAFCEICCKEFCNKYFLRTHKFKKHGIGSMPEPPNSQPGGEGSSSSNGAPVNNNNKSSPSQREAEQKTPLNLTSSTPPALGAENGMPLNCELCQRPFQSAYLLHMHKTYFHNQSAHGEPAHDEDAGQGGADVRDDDEDSSGSAGVVVKAEPKPIDQDEAESSAINISADLQKLQSMIMELNGANQATHRWPEAATKGAPSITEGSPQFINSSSAGNGGGIVKIVQQHEQSSDVAPSGTPSTSTTSTACQLCGGKDFFTPYFLQIHMQNYHGIGSTETMDAAVAAAASQLGLDRLLQDLNQSSPTAGGAGQLAAAGANAKRPANRSSSSGSGASGAATRSYCQICNKELCNKYFMKTHMLKMHGIHLEASGGGAQIGGVQCDICHKELCSKYFLKVHKQNTHGIVYPDSEQPNSSKEAGVMDLSFNQNQSSSAGEALAPSPASKSEGCPFCPKRFKSAKALRSHVSHEHPNGPGAASTCCYICNQPFGDVVALQVHLIKSHANQVTDQSATPPPPPPPPPPPLADHSRTTSAAFQCSFCEFSSTSLPYLFAHERTHHADQQQQSSKATEAELEHEDQAHKVQCPLCAEPLPLEQFQTHLMAHQLPANFLHTLIPAAPASKPAPASSSRAQHGNTSPAQQQQPNSSSKKKLRNRRYRCSVCRDKFATRQLCLTHILQLHPPIIRSSVGGKGSVSPVSAASSLIQSPRALSCPRCGFSTRLAHALRAHVRSQQCVPVVSRNPELQQLTPYMAVPTSAAAAAGAANNDGLLQVQGQHAHRQDFVLQAFLLSQPGTAANKRRSKSSDETNASGQQQQQQHDDGLSEDGNRSALDGEDERESSPSKSANNDDDEEGQSCNFIPSLILLPVNRRIANPLSMTFSLTPA